MAKKQDPDVLKVFGNWTYQGQTLLQGEEYRRSELFLDMDPEERKGLMERMERDLEARGAFRDPAKAADEDEDEEETAVADNLVPTVPTPAQVDHTVQSPTGEVTITEEGGAPVQANLPRSETREVHEPEDSPPSLSELPPPHGGAGPAPTAKKKSGG